jgi:AcrR family transcriptional regulator
MSATPPTSRQRREPLQERGHDKVRRLLEAADELLARGGAQELTTPRVAEAAGVAVGTLYRWFPDKEAIVEALAVRHWSELHAVVEAVAEAEERALSNDPFGAVIGALADGFRARPGFLSLWYSNLRTERVRDATRPGRDEVARSIERVLAAHHPDADATDRATAARMVVLLGDGIVREAFRLDRNGDTTVLAEGTLALRAYVHARLAGAGPDR